MSELAATPDAEMLDAALAAHRAGFCILPPREDGSKQPIGDSWTEYQERRPSEEQTREWYADGRTGVGYVCGDASGGLEVLDFDDLDVFRRFVELVTEAGLRELYERIEAGYSEHSPRGFHLGWRCKVTKTEKLAVRPKRPEEMKDPNDKWKTLIETKGEGGYIIVAPTHGRVHPEGKAYRQARGGPATIATITPEERQELLRIARLFDQRAQQAPTAEKPKPASQPNGELRPGDDFNTCASWGDVLLQHGWTWVYERSGEVYVRRPGKDWGISATVNYRDSDLLYVFSTNTPFEDRRGYSKFAAYALLNCDNDFAAAASELAKQGYGTQAAEEPPPSEDSGEGQKPRRPALSSISFSGKNLLELADRPPLDDLHAGIPVRGHFNLKIAPPMTGKTTWAEWIAMAIAAGVAPWEDAPVLGPGRVMMVSLDEAPEQVSRRMRGLAVFHPAGLLERYADNIEVIGPDREVNPSALDALRFEEFGGLAILDHWLEEAEREDRRFVYVFVDAYADVLPLDKSENSNEEATRIGGALERIAVRRGPGITVLHHTGKPKLDAGDELPDVRFLGRGASALAAKARVVSSLEQVAGMPHLRRIRTVTNLGRPPKPLTLQVCAEDSEPGELLYFRFHDPLAAHSPHELLAPGEAISTNQLAWRLAGKEPETGKSPPGEMKNLATQLRERWRAAGLVVVIPGPKKSKLIHLAEPAQEDPK